MRKILVSLKEKNLVDERELWVKGQILKTEVLGCPCNTAGVVMSTLENMRILSVKGNELIESTMVNKEPRVIGYYSKDNVESATVKSAFLGLSRKFIIISKEGTKIVFIIGVNKNFLAQMAEIFN